MSKINLSRACALVMACLLGLAAPAPAQTGGPAPQGQGQSQAPSQSRPAPEQPRLVVIELFTSQGCPSCPPADALIAELAELDDVMPLALHVDYWDYIGWRDIFASPEFTRRQKAYARAAGQRSVYTPQMVVGGSDHVVGFRPMQVAELIAAHRARPALVQLTAQRVGAQVVVRAEPPAERFAEDLVLQIVRYDPLAIVHVAVGENAGRTLRHVNVVRNWKAVARWDGAAPLRAEVEAGGNDAPIVAILQRAGPGEIVAAARAE